MIILMGRRIIVDCRRGLRMGFRFFVEKFRLRLCLFRSLEVMYLVLVILVIYLVRYFRIIYF